MDIFILRHGDAAVDTKKLVDDSKRSLSDVGISEIENVSRLLALHKIELDYIFSSPLNRAKQTAKIISEKQKKAKLIELDELKPEGVKEDIARTISKQNVESKILIVGHTPLLLSLLNYIISSEEHAQIRIPLKTGSLARIKTISIDPQLKGDLFWLLSPKLIRKLSK